MDDCLTHSTCLQTALAINVNAGTDQAAQKRGGPVVGPQGLRDAMREEVLVVVKVTPDSGFELVIEPLRALAEFFEQQARFFGQQAVL